MDTLQDTLFDVPDKWSYSKIKSLLRCPLEFKLRYKDEKQAMIVQGIDPWAGRVLHNIVGEYFKDPKYQLSPLDSLMEIYMLRRPEKPEWQENPLGEQRVVRAIEKFSQSDLATRRAEAVEMKCSADIAGVIFTGRIDLLCSPSIQEDGSGLIEFKLNVGEVESDRQVDMYLQLLLYQTAIEKTTNKKIRHIGFYYFELGQLIEINTSRELHDASTERFGELLKQAKSEDFVPRFNRFCTSCGYSKTCSEFCHYMHK